MSPVSTIGMSRSDRHEIGTRARLGATDEGRFNATPDEMDADGDGHRLEDRRLVQIRNSSQ
jgi:hypothetical protein